jgi:hypothetical protein
VDFDEVSTCSLEFAQFILTSATNGLDLFQTYYASIETVAAAIDAIGPGEFGLEPGQNPRARFGYNTDVYECPYTSSLVYTFYIPTYDTNEDTLFLPF